MTWLAGILGVIAFFVFSSIAIVWANGLRFNPDTGSFERTVLIALEGDLEDVTILLNGKRVGSKLPLRLRNLLAGRYEVVITKEGYQSWRNTFTLDEGQVGLVEKPVLIAINPLISTSTRSIKFAPLGGTLDDRLSLEKLELRDRGVLITRFLEEPLQVRRFNNGYLYQLGNQLRLFFPSGNQDFFVTVLPTNTLVPLSLFQSTWQVAYPDQDKTVLVSLTVPSQEF